MTGLRLDGLDLRHLAALRAVADRGTFGAAAEQLGYSQAAVSQQIAALERIVGCRLFDRPGGPRPVRLTAAGRLVLDHAHQVLDRVAVLERDLVAFRDGVAGRVEVGVFQSVAVKVLPAVVARLRAEVGPVDVRPHEDLDAGRLLERVAAGDLDLTFTATAVDGADDPPALRHLELLPLACDPHVAVVPADHPAVGVLRVAELAGAPMVGQPAADTCQARIDTGLARGGVVPDYVFRTGDNAALQSMVRAGMGVTVMPLLAVDMADPGIRVLALDPPLPPRLLGLAVGPGPSPVTRRFAAIAAEVCAEVVAAAPDPVAVGT